MYGYTTCYPSYTAPAYGYCDGGYGHGRGGGGFALIVVLFILLIIVGASFIR
jgi:uncharacterized protein (TIGR01732 family)